MNLKKIGLKVLSVIMVISMMVGVFAPVVSALKFTPDEHNDVTADKKDKLNYVSLGDSMTNGYGLPGYDANSGVEDYGNGSYANLFAQWLANHKADEVDHAQLAMSGIRAEDLHWLLELDYEDQEAIDLIAELIAGDWDAEKWNAKFSTGDFWTLDEICDHSRADATYNAIKAKLIAEGEWDGFAPATHGDGSTRAKRIALVAKYFQTKVAEGDILSLGIGNGNFGVFMFGRILEAIGFGGEPSEAMVYDIESAIRELDPEMQKTVNDLITEMYTALADLGIEIDDGNDAKTSTMEALVNTVIYTAVSYVLGYAGTVEAILQLNPDAEIVLVALMNTFGDEEFPEGDLKDVLGELSLGNLLEVVFEPLNKYIAALPTIMQVSQNSVYKDAKFYYAEADKVECIVDTYTYPIENPIVRDRFFKSIVVEDGKLGMVWGMLGSMVTEITLAEVEAYENMTDEEKLAYAVAYADKAMSISIYLAFEKAVVETKDNSVTIGSVFGLSDLLDPANDPFGAIMTEFYAAAAIAGADKFDTVCGFMAATVESLIEKTANDLLASKGISGTVDIDVTAGEIEDLLAGTSSVADDIANRAVAAIVEIVAPVYTKSVIDPVYEGIEELLSGINYSLTNTYGVPNFELTVEGYYNVCYSAAWEASDAKKLELINAFYIDAKAPSGFCHAYLADYIDNTLTAIETANSLPAGYFAGSGLTGANVVDAAYAANPYGLDNAVYYAGTVQNDDTIAVATEAYIDTMLGGGSTAKSYIANMISTNEALTADNAELLCTLLVMPEVLGDTVVDSELSGLLALFGRCVIGNGLGGHPSAAGHKTLADAVIDAYENEHTAKDETIENALIALEALRDFILENYEEAYKMAYAEAKDAGVIDEINGYLKVAKDALIAAEDWVVENGAEYVRSDAFEDQFYTVFDNAEDTLTALEALINNADELDEETYEYLLVLADALNTNVLDVATLLLIAADDAGEYAYEKALELNAQIEKQIAILKAEVEAKIAALKAEAESKIAALKAEAEAKIAALKAELENAVGEAKAAILAEIARIEAELNAKIAEIEAELNAAIEAVKADVEAKIAALEAAVNAKIAEIEAKIAELKEDIAALNNAAVEAIEAARVAIENIIANADEYLSDMLGEAYDKFVAAVVKAFNKLAPEAADYVYNWLYNNPEKVIAFFNEYGDDAFEFVKDNYETIIAVLGFIAVNYGEKMINYVMENSDTILPAIMGWFEIHGENTWELVKVYLTALGLKIDIIELDPAILADALNELRGFAKAILAELLAGSLDKIETVNVLKYLLSVIEGLEAKLDEALNNVDAAIKAEIKGQIGAIKAEIKGLINKIENALTTGDYTVTDDSYYAAITGSANGYVELLANALWLTEGQYTNMHWSEIDYAELMKADLITIGYDESDINGFAVNQMLGYVKAYIANVLKPNAANYLNDVLALVFDEGATTEEIRATFEAAMNEILEGDILKGKEYTELDWAGLVGEANVEYVEQIKQELYNELNKNNIPDTYTLTIDVVPYLVEYSGLKASFLYDTLGDLAYFTVEIPVAEVIVCGAESYVYSYASFSKAYAETIVTVSIYNPDATIIALGGYNPFKNIEFTVGDASIDLGAAYNMVSNLTSLHALLYAVAADVIYVEADDVVTIYDEAIAAGNAEADLISFILAYVSDPTVAQPGAAGYEYIKTQILNALNVTCEHVYDDMCTDAFCNRCGAEREDFEGHDIVIDEGYDATCTEEGLTEGKHCNTCGNVIVAQEVIPALGHDEVIDEVVLPTCTETGLTKGSHCGRCGEILDAQEVIPAHGHNEVIDEAVAPTCHETGLTEGSHCSACGQVFVAQEVVPALGHNEVIDAAVEATCTETGLTEGKHCDVCGEVIVAQEVVPAKGHTEVADAAVEATCTETGLTAGSHCSVCNTVIVAQETVAAKGHTEVVDAAKKATCTETGLTEGKHCSVCNTVIVAQQTVAALGHTEVIVAGKDATCTETGLTEGKYCSVCDTVLVAQETVAATGHKAGAAATCTEAQKCTVCNEELAEALGHKYENACDATCDICDETRTVADHVYGDWKVDTEATEDAEGKRSKTCSVCGNVVSETIPMLEKEGLSGGAVAAIVSVSVLAVGGAGVGVFFFIKKKKGI